jgi:hypothetical protein
MSKRIFRFNVGDRVTPACVESVLYGETGLVDEQLASDGKVVVNVKFDNRKSLIGFRDHDLRLVEPAPTVNKPKAPQPKFKVGDIVRVEDNQEIAPLGGKLGEVVGLQGGLALVQLDGVVASQVWFNLDRLEPAPTVSECLTPDNVNHPAHYNQGGIECIEAIKAATGSGFVKYCTGNVIKYLWRYDLKGGVEDLKKAAWYLDRAIKEMGNE